MYNYERMDPQIPNTATIQKLAGIERKRYPSSAFESWGLKREVIGV